MQPFTPKYVAGPVSQLNAHRQQAFDHLLASAVAHSSIGVRCIDYECSYPKHEFLKYLIGHYHVLLHGSNDTSIEILEPRAESDKAGERIHAVFAASDGIWPMFFAVLDRKPYSFSVNHGCRQELDDAGVLHRIYNFSTSTLHDHPWTNGMMYILPSDTFVQQRNSKGDLYDEWASKVAVKPLAKLAVTPADFPFLDEVQYHTHS